jgi:hypothetical protein
VTQLDLFADLETPASAAAPQRNGRRGAVAADLGGEAVPVSPKPRRKTKRAKPQAPTNAQPTVERGDGWWRLTFPAPAPMLSSNSRHHWRKTSPIRKTWREAMYLYARHAKLPTGLDRIRVDVLLRMPTARKADAPNFHQYVCKPLVDAIGPARDQIIRRGSRAGTVVHEPGYGVIPDDTERYIDGPHPSIGQPARDRAMPFGQVVVTITDLSAEVVA